MFKLMAMAGLVRGRRSVGEIERMSRREAAGKPSFYLVVLHRDESTPARFVTDLLCRYFAISREESARVVRLAECFGASVIGIYPFEIAEAKAEQGMREARRHGYPLRLSLRKEPG